MEEDFGTKWLFIGLLLSATAFVIVLFSFPQVSAAAISIITPDSEYQELGVGSTHIPINPSSVGDMSENDTHLMRIYLHEGEDRSHIKIRSTSKKSGTLNKARVKYKENGETTYESYWTTEGQELGMGLDPDTTYRFTKTGNEYNMDKEPTRFKIQVEELYKHMYRDDFEWRPIKYSDRYGEEVVVYGIMKMPYQSKVIPLTKYKTGKMYVDKDTGIILEAHISHNYGDEPIHIDYYSRAVPRPVSPYDWVKPSNF